MTEGLRPAPGQSPGTFVDEATPLAGVEGIEEGGEGMTELKLMAMSSSWVLRRTKVGHTRGGGFRSSQHRFDFLSSFLSAVFRMRIPLAASGWLLSSNYHIQTSL